MKKEYETFPDDLRLRCHLCGWFRREAFVNSPPIKRPYTVIAGLANGKAEIGFTDRSRSPLVLCNGDVCVLPANCCHYARAISPAGADFLVTGFVFEIRGGVDFLSLFDVPFHLSLAAGRTMSRLLEELHGLEINSPGSADLRKNVSIQRIGYAMLESILAVSTPIPGMLSLRQFMPIIKHLNDNFTARPDLRKLMKQSGISRTHFFRIFKSQTGTTPVGYIKRRRLREALLLLQESDLSISEIGNQVGWPDSFYFSKIFKSEIGMAPTAYRIRHKESIISASSMRDYKDFRKASGSDRKIANSVIP